MCLSLGSSGCQQGRGKAAAREEGGKSGDVVASFGMAELTDWLGDSKVLAK